MGKIFSLSSIFAKRSGQKSLAVEKVVLRSAWSNLFFLKWKTPLFPYCYLSFSARTTTNTTTIEVFQEVQQKSGKLFVPRVIRQSVNKTYFLFIPLEVILKFSCRHLKQHHQLRDYSKWFPLKYNYSCTNFKLKLLSSEYSTRSTNTWVKENKTE